MSALRQKRSSQDRIRRRLAQDDDAVRYGGFRQVVGGLVDFGGWRPWLIGPVRALEMS